MYTINSNKEFFERFDELKLQITELSCLFQNSQTEASYEEIAEWYGILFKLQGNLSKLVKDAGDRIITV